MRFISALIFLASFISQAFAEDLVSGKWRGESEVSALTDKASMMWRLDATNLVATSIGNKESPWMLVRCNDNRTDLIFSFNNFMGSDQQDVRFRIDGGKVRTNPAIPSQDGRAIGFWGGLAPAILQELSTAKKFVVAASPYQSIQVEGVFELEGIDQVIAGIRKTCNW